MATTSAGRPAATALLCTSDAAKELEKLTSLPAGAVVRHRNEIMLDHAVVVLDLAPRLEGRRIARVRLGKLADLAVERGREEHRLAVGRDPADDPLDLRLEAHVEHAVRLVEDEDLDVVEGDHLPLDEVLKPPGRRDDDVRALEPLGLRPDWRAAVGDTDPDALRGSEGLDRVGHLERELPGRHEHESLGGLTVSGDPLDERDSESDCLARSGRRLCKDVASGERIGQNERLNAKRLDNVERRERLLHGRAYAKRVEGMLHVVVRLL